MIPAFLNPDAGTARRAAEALSSDSRFSVRSVPPTALEEALEGELNGGRRRILVAGGDGTVATAAHALARTGVELAILPAGTLNHFARDMGLPTNPRSALDLAAGPSVRSVDVGYVNGRTFLNTSSLGVYPELARQRDRMAPWIGHRLAVALSGARVFAGVSPLSARLSIGDVAREYRTPLFFVGVGERDLTLSGFGRRLETPAGRLHVVVVREGARRHLLALALATAARGIWRVARTAGADSFLVEECRLDVGTRPTRVALDGDVHPMTAPLRYRIVRDGLTVVAPRPPAGATRR